MAPEAAAAPSPEEIHREKLAWAHDHPGARIPTNVEWVRGRPEADQAALRGAVRRRPTRSLSGVAVVAVMTAPARCPHGRCTYCPGGVENSSPQSYTGEEPSALRGAQFGYDAQAITSHRIETLQTIGHSTSKVEVILMGGTFPSRPRAYQTTVFQGVFDGLNGHPSPTLVEAQVANESAEHRCVSLTVETRPDWCDGRILPFLLDAGVTRVELGVECLREEVLWATGRAHGVEAAVSATREARDRGLKVCYHLMLGLPGMDPAKDREDVARVFNDPAFRPDMVKIYPTLVLPGTPLFDDWKSGRYAPYDAPTAAALLADIKRELPAWVRVQRIQRDIPARLIADGVRASNVRELAIAQLATRGERCRCLRCREVGRRATPPLEAFEPTEVRYPAAGGTEVFLGFEEPASDTIAAFLRLRYPSSATPGGLDAPVIRELKVLGTEISVGSTPSGPQAYQHRGLGSRLLRRAEDAAIADGYRTLYVLSAVGTRAYYRRHGFERSGPHMVKPLFSSRNGALENRPLA